MAFKRPPHVLSTNIRTRVMMLKDLINKRFSIRKEDFDGEHVRQEQINRLVLETLESMQLQLENLGSNDGV